MRENARLDDACVFEDAEGCEEELSCFVHPQLREVIPGTRASRKNNRRKIAGWTTYLLPLSIARTMACAGHWHNSLPLIESIELFHCRMNTGYYRHSIRSRCSPVISLVLHKNRHQTDTMDRHQRKDAPATFPGQRENSLRICTSDPTSHDIV